MTLRIYDIFGIDNRTPKSVVTLWKRYHTLGIDDLVKQVDTLKK